MQHAIPVWVSGANQLLHAKGLEFSAARAEAKEKATTERLSEAWRTLGPYLGIVAQQVMAKKMGVTPVAHPPTSAPANGEPAERELPSMVDLANDFGGGLTCKQRSELNRLLTKKQMGAFDALFCADTDAAAFDAYQGVAKHAGDKLAVLQGMLDADQTNVLGAFMASAAHYAEEHPPAE